MTNEAPADDGNPSNILNLYGDRLPRDTGRRGANIASQRIDDLDARCIDYAVNLKRKARRNFRSLDLGCGDGIQGVRLSLLGYESHLYDREPLPEVVFGLRDLYELMRFRYHRCDLSDPKAAKFPSNGVDVVYSQRFIHYLRYSEAQRLIARIAKVMTPGGHFYLSASGKGSEIGLAHPQRALPIEMRYEHIDPAVAKKHSIHEPICVYSLSELEELMYRSGFITVDIWESDFGNVKGIFSKETTG